MGKTNIPDGYECSLIAIGGLVLDAKSGAGNLAAFAPPDKAELWRLDFKDGDVGITDGNVLVVYGKKARKTKGRDEKTLISLPGGSKGG
ncbi:MAG TPA: hypothetical protein PLC21_10925 [Deltaproteobacteria bacterium]|nr:hypothetical protein [Deltaproteobacteria bacterium]